jgi:hypothetical protein
MAVATLDTPPRRIPRLAEVPSHPLDAAQAIGTLVVMPLTRVGVGHRRQQRVAPVPRRVEDAVGVVVAIAQHLACPRRLTQHVLRYLGFRLVQGRHLPRLWHNTVGPERVPLVAFGLTAGTTAEAGILVFADAADGQGLAVQKGQQASLLAVAQVLFQGVEEGTDGQSIQASGENGSRGQAEGA